MKRTNPLAPIRLLVEAVEQDHELCIGTGDFGDGDEPCPTCDVLPAAKKALEQVEYNEMLVASAGAQAQELERATARLARLEGAVNAATSDLTIAMGAIEPIPTRSPIIQGDSAGTSKEERDE